MPFTCPRCGARVEVGATEGALRCAHCETFLYTNGGTGIAHRIVSSCSPEADLRKAAEEWLRRAGRAPRTGAVKTFYIPYFVLQGNEGSTEWEGCAAISLPSPSLERIPILGSETQWFDPALAPPGAILLEPTLRSAAVAAGHPVRELRHVPLAQVECEDGLEPEALWVEAERCRVLDRLPAAAAALGPPAGLLAWLAMGAVCISSCALLLPFPWSIPAAGAIFMGFHRGGRGRFATVDRAIPLIEGGRS